MAIVRGLQCTGRASASEAAQAATDLVQLQQVSALFSGLAPLGHEHPAGDITGLPAELLALLDAILADSESAEWILSSDVRVSVRLKANGGVLSGPEGLYLHSGIAALAGHLHSAADITNFYAATKAVNADLLDASDTVEWTIVGDSFKAVVRLKANGGLQADAGGVSCVFGSGTNEVARGDHTHPQLHNPVTAQASQTIEIEINDQVLSLELKLAPLGGLVVGPSGVGVDFGAGANQVARGNHTHAQLHDPVTTGNTPSLTLGINAGQLLSGIVRTAAAPPAGRGKIVVTDEGLVTVLGTGADEAAPGNHGHDAATPSADGFLSAADKQILDDLAAAAALPADSFRKETLTVALESPVTTVGCSYYREETLIVGEYLLGSHDWACGVTILSARVTSLAPTGTPVVLTLEVNGVLTAQTLTIPAGSGEVVASAAYNVAVPPGQVVRWKVTSAPDPENSAWKVFLTLTVRGVIALGEAQCVTLPYSGTITGWDLIADLPSGTLGVDIYRDEWAAFPPGLADSIVGAFKPQISGSRHNQNTSVAWPFETGDVFLFHVDWATVVNRASLNLRITRG